ncbi:response regulator transcription factor [Phycicoccus sp. SLBN-51]|jgi:two-component system KDP operon response regulator KdpE|uniref:response regulator n=1 Tax=Phycicoccus sp. SLBN-51 TaxID=2768447 RepID=UPI00114D52D7|nr:response regulator transcription factor [Phycicoccus sp. SLBN-51]TQJ52161.1 two-component system KDP operon response regulator KdpE [Phycicoccus sp. SLBN-51]
MTRILVVEDESGLRRVLAINLRGHGYEVTSVADGTTALGALAGEPYDLVILDLGLPDLDGVEVVRRARRDSATPIIILSARDAQSEKVKALDAGADDYVTKPFGMQELVARVRANLRRTSPEAKQPTSLNAGALTIDFRRAQVQRGGEEVRLTPTEWHLLEALARDPGRLVPSRELLQRVWGPAYGDETNYLRVYMAQLRRKLEDNPSRPRHLITEPGLGYRFEA